MTWITSYGRYEKYFRCPRLRYFNYHAGAHGTGYERQEVSVPLATGTHVHLGLEQICKIIQKDGKASEEAVRMAASYAVTEYNKQVSKVGLADVDLDSADFTRQEQAHLIECLIWAWHRVVQPIVEREWEILEVESWDEVEWPTCTLVLRRDLVIRERSSGLVKIVDWKTAKGADVDFWINSWLDSVQLATQTLAWDRSRPWDPVSGYYMVGLVKGGYEKFSKPSQGLKTKEKRQYSQFCYAAITEANPPQIKHTTWAHKGAWYDRSAVWQAAFPDKPPEQSVAEYWVKQMDKEDLNQLMVLAGPYQRQEGMMTHLDDEIPAVEARILGDLHDLYKDPTEQRLNQLFPRSYACYAYNQRCEYYGPCRQGKDWTGYVERKPHHKQERE